MRRYGLLPVALLAYVLLAGCGTTALKTIAENQDCTVRVSGKIAFGSITPTGDTRWSAVCKPAASPVPVAQVTEPPAP